MRLLRRSLAAAVPLALLLAACGGDDSASSDGGSTKLTAAEREYVDAIGEGFQDPDDGLGVNATEAECMATAVVDVLGIEIFEDADVSPDDLSGDDSPGELLGAGEISDADAQSIVDQWNDCADLPATFAAAAGGDFDLDAAGQACFAEGLGKDGTLDEVLKSGFTSDTDDPPAELIQGILAIVTSCTGGPDGTGGVLVDSIAQSLEDSSGLTADEARCVAQAAVDTVGAERLLEMSSGGGDFSSAPAEVQQEIASAIVDAAATCNVNIADLGA